MSSKKQSYQTVSGKTQRKVGKDRERPGNLPSNVQAIPLFDWSGIIAVILDR